MNHVSETEVFEYLDRRMSEERQRAIGVHCTECVRCRNAVEFHRAAGRSAAAPVIVTLSDNFTERVLRQAHAPAPRSSWLMQNMSNLVAMAVVLSILAAVGFAVSQSSASASTVENSSYMRVFTFWRDASSGAVSSLVKHTTETTAPLVTGSEKTFGSAFWIGIAALVLFGLADRMRGRMKAMTLL